MCFLNKILHKKPATNTNNHQNGVGFVDGSRPIAEQIQHTYKPNNTISIPSEYMGLGRAYSYKDVSITPVPGASVYANSNDELSFKVIDGRVNIFQNNHLIGYVDDSNVSRMICQWIKKGDPILSYVLYYPETEKEANICIGFYCDLLKVYKDRNPEAKEFKLIGQPEDFVFDIVKGAPCEIDYDIDKNKYIVSIEGETLGCLPATAVKFAEQLGYEPADLSAVLLSCELNYDTDKYDIRILVC